MPSDLQSLLDRVESRLAEIELTNKHRSDEWETDTVIEESLAALLRALIAKEGR